MRLSTLLLTLLILLGGAARADGPAWQSRYQHGMAAFDAGRYLEALGELTAAYQEKPLPRLLVAIGQTQRKLGRPDEAVRYFARYLEEEPAFPDPPMRQQAVVLLARARGEYAAQVRHSDAHRGTDWIAEGLEAGLTAQGDSGATLSRRLDLSLALGAVTPLETRRQRPTGVVSRPTQIAIWSTLGVAVAGMIAVGVVVPLVSSPGGCAADGATICGQGMRDQANKIADLVSPSQRP